MISKIDQEILDLENEINDITHQKKTTRNKTTDVQSSK